MKVAGLSPRGRRCGAQVNISPAGDRLQEKEERERGQSETVSLLAHFVHVCLIDKVCSV